MYYNLPQILTHVEHDPHFLDFPVPTVSNVESDFLDMSASQVTVPVESATSYVLDHAAFDNLVSFVAKRNARNRYFIPSAFNTIKVHTERKQDINQKHCMVDDGCNSVLLYVENNKTILNVLRPAFPLKRYTWDVKRGKGVGSSTLVLEISCKDNVNDCFEMILGEDLGGRELKLERLRFHLCTEDINTLSTCMRKKIGSSNLSQHFSVKAKNLIAFAAAVTTTTASHGSAEDEGEQAPAVKGASAATSSITELVHPRVVSAAKPASAPPAAVAGLMRSHPKAVVVERRQHALIGQAVLGHHKSYGNTDFRYFLTNDTLDPFEAAHMTTTLLENIINGTTAELLSGTGVVDLEPHNFEDMEDDDAHIGDELSDEDVDSGDEE